MALNAQLDLATATEQLRSHRLKALFTQTLGWQPVQSAHTGPIQLFQQQCIPLATDKNVTVWQVLLTVGTELTAALRQQIYGAIAAANEQPLVVFINAAKTRSLWCQSPQESALYIAGQPMALWKFRLRRLAQGGGLFPQLDVHTASYETFAKLLQGLCQGISGISNTADRQAYAVLTLKRLIFIQTVQQQGWIDGDTWYLQTRFGTAMQQGKLFFETCLQPLYQSLSLPALERPLALQTGEVPFLGHWFDTHRLERRYPAIAIGNQPFEEILGWLSEQASIDALNPWMSGGLGYLLERYWAESQTASYVGTPELARELSDRTLDRLLLDRLEQGMPLATTAAENTLNDRLFNASSELCRCLIQEILPDLRLLDPACGSGNLLVALHQRLMEIFSILIGHIRQTQDPQLKIWLAGLIEQRSASPNLLQTIQKRILKNNLYGVELTAGAAETTRFQLLLYTVTTAQHPQEIEPLIDLSFNIMTGNALIGLIAVDAARFDQISKAGDNSVLQGNLLQPLVADSYQTTLAEKNLALEHYKSRNQLLAAAKNIPPYARAALLREDILRLDAKAQGKLDTLLLNHMSQQLGIQYKATQLTDKPQRRLLTPEDIDVLQPFHWGYHFNTIMRKGGFDVIVCAPPWGAFKPTTEEFFRQFQDLAEANGMNAYSLKTSKQALAKGDSEVTQAWLFYQSQYAYVADYFYRSEQYTHQDPTANGKPVRNQLSCDRLFTEQCFNLLNTHGIAAVILPSKLSQAPKAQPLRQFLQESTLYDELACDKLAGAEAAITVWKMQAQ